MLEDHADFTPCITQRVGGQGRQIAAVDQDAPGARTIKQIDRPHQRALARAAAADDAEDFTLANLQIDVAHRFDRALRTVKSLEHAFYFYHCKENGSRCGLPVM